MPLFNYSPGSDGKYTELTKQIQNYMPVVMAFNAKTMVSFLDKAIRTQVYPTISREFYEAINQNTEAYPTELVELLRTAIVNLAFSSYASIGTLQISNVGFVEAQTDTQKPARLETIHKFQQEVSEVGFKTLDELLIFIESSATTNPQQLYTAFIDAKEYAEIKERIIRTAKEFNKYFPINESRIVFFAVQEDMKYVEFFEVETLLYPQLFEKIQAEPQNYQKLINHFVKPAIAYLSIARAVQKLTAILGLYNTITIFDNTANNYGKTHKTAPADLLEKYKQAIEKQGRQYLANMVKHIQDNPELYPEYPTEPEGFSFDDIHTEEHNHPRVFVM